MTHSPLILGADHAGFELKELLKKHLQKQDVSFQDMTPLFRAGDDYPPIAQKVARAVVKRKTLGLLICGSGFGMDIAANRIKGARAAIARNVKEVKLSRRDDLANILVLGARLTNPVLATRILSVWMTAPVGKAKRFVRRVKEMDV